MRIQRVWELITTRLVAATTSDVIDRHHTMGRTESVNHATPIETPGGIAVHTKNRVLARAFIQIAKRVRTDRVFLGAVRKQLGINRHHAQSFTKSEPLRNQWYVRIQIGVAGFARIRVRSTAVAGFARIRGRRRFTEVWRLPLRLERQNQIWKPHSAHCETNSARAAQKDLAERTNGTCRASCSGGSRFNRVSYSASQLRKKSTPLDVIRG